MNPPSSRMRSSPPEAANEEPKDPEEIWGAEGAVASVEHLVARLFFFFWGGVSFVFFSFIFVSGGQFCFRKNKGTLIFVFQIIDINSFLCWHFDGFRGFSPVVFRWFLQWFSNGFLVVFSLGFLVGLQFSLCF